MPLYDFVCETCGETEIHFLSVAECTTPQACEKCGGTSHRAYIGAPTVNTSESASHVFVPQDKKFALKQFKADNAWKAVKDPKKRKELKEAAAELRKYKS